MGSEMCIRDSDKGPRQHDGREDIHLKDAVPYIKRRRHRIHTVTGLALRRYAGIVHKSMQRCAVEFLNEFPRAIVDFCR